MGQPAWVNFGVPRNERTPGHPAMPTFVKFLLACLLCLAVVGAAALLIQVLFG